MDKFFICSFQIDIQSLLLEKFSSSLGSINKRLGGIYSRLARDKFLEVLLNLDSKFTIKFQF